MRKRHETILKGRASNSYNMPGMPTLVGAVWHWPNALADGILRCILGCLCFPVDTESVAPAHR
jgi:hypothetical protein